VKYLKTVHLMDKDSIEH